MKLRRFIACATLTALALISFVGSVSVARFRVRDRDERSDQ